MRRRGSVGGSLVVLCALELGACAGGTTDDTDHLTLSTLPAPSQGDTRPPVIVDAGVPMESRPVAAAPDSALATVRRDCGFSLPLPAGGALWVYCDTAQFETDDRLRWFVNTSAALASDGEPLVMLDHETPEGRVEPFLEPDPDYPVCDDGEGRFTWPMSGVLVEGEALDEPAVAIWYHNVCVVPGAFEGQDAGLAIFAPPGEPPAPTSPDARPVLRAEVVDDRIVPDPADGGPFGQAAVRADDLVYLYRCPRSNDPCEVARVAADRASVADRRSYEVWTGDGWTDHGADGAAARPMEMPGSRRGLKPSVAWVDDLGVYVFADHLMSDPGRVLLRVARSPEGPWSEPADVDLPGCDDTWPDVCFAVEVHADLSSDDEVALTWFDPAHPRGREAPLRFTRIELHLEDT